MGAWTGRSLYLAWVNAPGSDAEREWITMNSAHVRQWEGLAATLDEEACSAESANSDAPPSSRASLGTEPNIGEDR